MILNIAAAVQGRLQAELGQQRATDNWLLPYLQANDYWIKAAAMQGICYKLQTAEARSPGGYYRDLLVWIPDHRFNFKSLPCPRCSSPRTGYHGVQTHHPARRVHTLRTCYYVMGRRHICHDCKEPASRNPIRL
jgi:hypothetical protein